MLPNEIINKIFQYRYRDFKIFLSKMKKINEEYREKFVLLENTPPSDICILSKKISDKGYHYFKYNYRRLRYSNMYEHIFYPAPYCCIVAKLSKNYC